jgi:hypothetical protein
MKNFALRGWVLVRVALFLGVAGLALAVLDLGAAVGSFGKTIPDAFRVSDSGPATETVVAQRTGKDVSALLRSWEGTAHCDSTSSCASCANPGQDCSPIMPFTCGTNTNYYPTCCGNWNSNTCTFTGKNSCNPQCINCCSN